MHKILQKLEALSCRKLHWMAVGLSILIATQVQYIQHGWTNPDSVLYLEAAKLFTQGAWQAGFDVFSWPFYALCIAFISKISLFNVHLSAQILNVLFFSIATYSFIQIIQLAGGKQRQMIAGALIWLSAQYMIGGVLEMLMRDEGFWAFYLSSLVFFIRYYQQHQFKDALLWQVSIIVATLFRIEAILYLVFLPFILLFQTGFNAKQKWKNLLLANAINISLALVIICVFAFNNALSTKLLGRLNEVFTTNLWQQFIQHLNEKSSIMSNQVLGEYLNEFAVPGLLMTFLYVICVRIISSTGLIIVGLSAFAIKGREHLFNQQAFQVLSATAMIALLNMTLIITKVFVLSGRYVLALSFILMVFAAFYFAELLFNDNQNKKAKWLVLALIVFMLGGAVKNVFPKKQGYNYMQDAVAWVSADNLENKPVFYDQARMRYYAGAQFIGTFDDHFTYLETMIANKSIDNHHYILVESSNKDKRVKMLIESRLPQYKLIKQFKNAKATKSVLIYVKKKNND